MERILGVQTLAETKRFRIEGVDIDFGNGKTHQFERIQFQGTGRGVLIVPLERGLKNDLSDTLVYMIEHFVVGTESRVLMLPGGHRENDYTLTQAANQELQEEIGMKSDTITFLIDIESPGYVMGTTTFCLAENLSPSVQKGDEYEDITLHKIFYTDALDMITQGTISDVRTIAALLYAYRFILSV